MDLKILFSVHSFILTYLFIQSVSEHSSLGLSLESFCLILRLKLESAGSSVQNWDGREGHRAKAYLLVYAEHFLPMTPALAALGRVMPLLPFYR